MFLHPVETAFARFRTSGDARALAIVFDRTAPELLRLARHFACRGSEAEDLVQATFLTAIEAAASFTPGCRVLPWLAGILANHARVARRRQTRRPDAARLAGEPLGDAGREAERNELTAEVEAGIARASEPYRPVLRLWLQHGLDANEIAATLERPAGTVRAQISRGLEQLRRTLPASLAGAAAIAATTGRGLAAVRQTVLGTCAGTPSGTLAALALGGLIVLNHKLLAGLTMLAIALVLWKSSGDVPGAPPALPRTDPTASAMASAGPPIRGDADTTPDPEREAVVDASPSAATAAPPAAAAEHALRAGSLRVTVVVDGVPQPQIGVAVRRNDAKRDAPLFRRTGDDGAVLFRGMPAGSVTVDVDRGAETVFAHIADGEAATVTIALGAGTRVTGTVVDARGNPVAGAQVVAHGDHDDAPVVATSDARGAFAVDHVGKCRLQARAPGHSPSTAHPVLGAAGPTVALTLRLGDTARRISGRVTSGDGAPVADCAVAIEAADAATPSAFDLQHAPHLAPLWLRTDANGWFRTDEAAPGTQRVIAVPQDPELAVGGATIDVRDADVEVVVRCKRTARIEGTARLDGAPLDGAWVVAITEQPALDVGSLFARLQHAGTTTDANGCYRIDGALPGAVSLRFGQRGELLGERKLDLAPGDALRCDLDATTTTVLQLRIVTPGALPSGLAAWVHDPGQQSLAPKHVDFRDDGTATLPLQRFAELDVTIGIQRGRQFQALARQRRVTPGRGEVRFELTEHELPSSTLRGRLVDALGAPQSGVRIVVVRYDGSESLGIQAEGDTTADGSFAFGPLAAGTHTLLTGPANAPEHLAVVTVVGGRDAQLGDVRRRPD